MRLYLLLAIILAVLNILLWIVIQVFKRRIYKAKIQKLRYSYDVTKMGGDDENS